MFHNSSKLLGITVLSMLCTLAVAWPSAAAGTPAQQCQASKLKASGKKAACRLTAMAKIATGGAADLTKCSAKFPATFTKAETKAGVGVCPTESDASAIESTIDADTDALQAKLSGVRFVDNGDGTVTDNQTGLQWEQKHVACTFYDLHCVYDSFSWTASPPSAPYWPNGEVSWEIFSLNDEKSLDEGVTLTGCFANHCDWRLLSIRELQTILLAAYPCTSPCIDPIFGPTNVNPSLQGYWSSTSVSDVPAAAWGVNFDDGSIFDDDKSHANYVRAVRTGS
jgi:hypothetical protein